MKQYLVIGGSSGIGAATARLLAREEDTQVWATYHQHPQPDTPGIRYAPLDVRDPAVDLSFLPEKLDGLLYCPGRILLKPFGRLKPEELAEDFDVQVGGFVRVLQAALPCLKASGAASVVAFSTVAVQRGFPFHSAVSASKGALEGLCRTLAAELAPAVRVNCIAPSITDTPLAAGLLSTEEKVTANAQRHPLKRIGTPDDLAQMAAFLLSAGQSSWITGQVLHVDGGMSL